ncbi:asparagine synthase (glutamine-hydrolyzing) [Mucilaginibacter antarcticus]|uniref:asparagine synthase (glutamine-hydrolyzing) n=1 Tax=Mucilaginibacter antarcticus TaxID=1855725 RepID=A0ABW5XLH1_9SPHI
MCRIAGTIAKQHNTAALRANVAIMCNALKHGGPDDEGFYADENAGLVFGHRRLSIIDLSNNGHQPMPDAGKKAWITFNGEIYNYLDLKSELVKLGARFNSNSDTEVIIQAYLHWGTAAFAKLRGMFAFALFDTVKALTYLVRDSLGIKPLYYHIDKGQLSFASEVRALKVAGIATETNKSWMIRFLAFGHVPEPETTLKGVFNLPKGNYLRWDHNKEIHHISSYQNTQVPELINDIETAKEVIANGLNKAINRQLIADAPIGVFLSGGIDSSIITLLAAQYRQEHLKTISIFFDEKAYDESAYQQAVLNKIEGEKFSHLVKQSDFQEALPTIINAMDMPTTDGVNTWFISKYARQDGVKAVLSGVGADELFGGYPSFNRMWVTGLLRSLPSAALAQAGKLHIDVLKRVSYMTNDHYLADYLLLRGLFTPLEIAGILDCSHQEVIDTLFAPPNIDFKGMSNKEKAAWFESNLYMQNQLLRDTDVMSMSHGLEVRVPFLDEDFQQAVSGITNAIRFDKRRPKKILIDTFADLLPKSVWDRRKMGFSFPLQQWMAQNLEIVAEDAYTGKKAKSVIKAFKGNKVHWSKAFALYQLQKHA